MTPKLQRAAGAGLPGAWWQRYPFSAAAMVWGVIAVICGLSLQFRAGHAITQLPDPRVMVPLFAVALGLGVAALVRREPQRLLAVCGLLLAATSVVMGWFVVVSAILLVAVLIGKIVAELI